MAGGTTFTRVMPDTPLRPDELPDYKTEVQTAEVQEEAPAASPAGNQHPWVLIGMVLLGIFVVVMVLAIGAALA